MKKLERDIRRHIARWTPRLGLQRWNIQWRIVPRADLDGDCVGDNDVNTRYLRSTIRFSDDLATGSWQQNVEAAVLHELVHILVDELNDPCYHTEEALRRLSPQLADHAHDLRIQAVEQLTERITWILLRAEVR